MSSGIPSSMCMKEVMAVKDVHVQSGQLAIFSDGDSLSFSSHDSNTLKCVVH